MNLLNLLDEDYNKDKKYISIINKITNDNNYEKYKIIDKNSNFKWSVDNQFVEILIKDCNIEDYQYYTFDLKGAIEGVKKNKSFKLASLAISAIPASVIPAPPI